MIFVSIVSHGHDLILLRGGLLAALAAHDEIVVVLKDNVPSARIKGLCSSLGIIYLDESPRMGFGENNNFVFRHIIQKIGFRDNDFFVLINPDVVIVPEILIRFVANLKSDSRRFGTINLYRESTMVLHDHSIRRFPSVLDIVAAPFGRIARNRYNKAEIETPCEVDWASAAVLAFEWTLFDELGGFDEQYFMYFEDVDICQRAKRKCGESLYYYPQYKAVHAARHANRNILSRHAWWFIHSFLRYKIKTGRRNAP